MPLSEALDKVAGRASQHRHITFPLYTLRAANEVGVNLDIVVRKIGYKSNLYLLAPLTKTEKPIDDIIQKNLELATEAIDGWAGTKYTYKNIKKNKF